MTFSTKGKWTRICVDSKCFIYGPRLGALYLLPADNEDEGVLFKILGLKKFSFQNELIDPALKVSYDLKVLNENEQGSLKVSKTYCLLYNFIHRSRHAIPFPMMLSILTKLFYIFGNKKRTKSAAVISKLIHGIERKSATSDCYPRAIMTACLCAQSRLSWDVTIGILAPTRLMHAWCSSNGVVLYEPYPEHYMYQPLIVFSKIYTSNKNRN